MDFDNPRWEVLKNLAFMLAFVLLVSAMMFFLQGCKPSTPTPYIPLGDEVDTQQAHVAWSGMVDYHTTLRIVEVGDFQFAIATTSSSVGCGVAITQITKRHDLVP